MGDKINALQKLDDLLNDIEMNCYPAIGVEPCIRFSLDCLALVQHKLPLIAEEARFLVAEYLEGRVSLQSIKEMLAKCWQYLKENRNHHPAEEPTESAIRAVIFPLTALRDFAERDIVDHLGLFLEFVNQVEPHYGEEEALLRKYFADCL